MKTIVYVDSYNLTKRHAACHRQHKYAIGDSAGE